MINNIIKEEKIIIGLCGKKFSGKSTFGKYVKDKYNFNIYSFGENLKKALKDIFYFSDDEVNGNKKEIINEYWNLTPREIMQYFGTELMRENFGNHFPNIGDKIWIKSLEFKLINDIQYNNINKIIIDDVRFNNEISWIKSFGLKYNFKTFIININNINLNNIKDNNDNIKDNNEEKFLKHKSETEKLNYEYTINNNKDNYIDFYNNIDNLFLSIKIEN